MSNAVDGSERAGSTSINKNAIFVNTKEQGRIDNEQELEDP